MKILLTIIAVAVQPVTASAQDGSAPRACLPALYQQGSTAAHGDIFDHFDKRIAEAKCRDGDKLWLGAIGAAATDGAAQLAVIKYCDVKSHFMIDLGKKFSGFTVICSLQITKETLRSK